jgi:hypothetical protein
MSRDLGGRIWIDASFYLRGEDAETFRNLAAAYGIAEDDMDGLAADLVLERLKEIREEEK